MGYVKAFLVKEFCEQCGFELFGDENYCSEYCRGMAKHDRDEWQDAPYKLEPLTSQLNSSETGLCHRGGIASFDEVAQAGQVNTNTLRSLKNVY